MAMNCPRDVCSAVSVAQTGTIAFRIPVPIPLMNRAELISHCEGIFDLEYETSPQIIQL
jgi:hypothetical protein